MVFSVPDAAVANLFYRKLRDKNRNLFSPFSYAYMKDRGLFDAVIQLRSYLVGGKKYVIQFDFAKYFDSIDHKYIEHLFNRTNFNVSDTEKYLIREFLKHPISDAKDYAFDSAEKRLTGVPQGSSLSLFLANMAGHELDRRLESTNGQFVRFADDIVAITNSHDDALNVLKSFDDHCRYSGIAINHEKSPGISILESAVKSEKRTFFLNDGDGNEIDEIGDFDYIGHKFLPDKIMLSTRGMKRTRRRVAKIIYLHLLYTLKKFKRFDLSRVRGQHFDWDLVTCVNEVRKFIYGGLKQSEIMSFVSGDGRLGKMRGFIGFCPLMDSIEQFRELDGWLLDVIRRALTERYRLIHNMRKAKAKAKGTKLKILRKSVPSKKALIAGSWYNGPAKLTLELGAPSFVLAWRAARKKYKQYGLDDFEDPKYYSHASSFPSISGLYET